MENRCAILVVGAGASGMTAALAARKYLSANENGSSVVLLEKNNRVGKKLLSTGNGRCNLSNSDLSPQYFHGDQNFFSRKIIKKRGVDWTIHFFSDLGVECIYEKDRLYPFSLHSSSVLDGLRLALSENSIQVETGQNVIKMTREKDHFIVETAAGELWRADALIAACGGAAAPETGSNGDGYVLLQHFSHKLIYPLPSLVQLKSSESFCKSVSGNKITGIVSLCIDGEKCISEGIGEILFTDYGLSGPMIMQLSGQVSRALHQRKKVEIAVDFLPQFSIEQIDQLLRKRKNDYGHRTLEEFLTGFFHRRIAYAILKKVISVPLSTRVKNLTDTDIQQLALRCKDFYFPITDTTGFRNAQTTAGGMDTSSFSSESLASLLVPGLFACGEILDVDGDCGGYNLQWAWASGYTAGKSAAEFIREIYP